MFTMLAQQGLSGPKLIGPLTWIGVVGGLIVAMGIVAGLWIRRLRRFDEAAGPAGGFSLSDLRRLHGEGKLSDEQFERAKAMVIAHMRAAGEAVEGEKKDSEGPADNIGYDAS